MKTLNEQVVDAFTAAAEETSFTFDGIDVEVLVTIKSAKIIGGIWRQGELVTGGNLSSRRTVHDLAKIAVARQSDYYRRAQLEYDEDVAVAGGAKPTIAPGTRMKLPGEWLIASDQPVTPPKS